MANFDYARARATADRLLTKFGRTATLRQTSTSGGDPWDPGSGTTTTTDTTVTAAVLEYANSEIDGTIILASDRKVYVSAEGIAVTPVPADVLIVGPDTLSIVNVKPLNPAGTVVMWELQVRQ